MPSILRTRLDAQRAPGLRYARTAITAPLGRRMPVPNRGRLGLIAAWDDDSALERFLGSDPLAERLACGWHVRLQPLRASGEWSAWPDLARQQRSVDDDEPVAVLTLGRLRLGRVRGFLSASSRAEREAIMAPGLLASTGLARPPGLVATFSLWETAAAMRDYAYHGDGHPRAVREHRERPFHHESIFARFRPYASAGTWDGRDPLAAATSGSGTPSAAK